MEQEDELSKKQMELYQAIATFIKHNGYSPTIRELCQIVDNKSTSPVFDKLNKLRKKGYITYIDGKSRTIRLLK